MVRRRWALDGWRNPVASSCYPQNFMPTDQILYLLIAERDKLNRAIEALQGRAKRRADRRKMRRVPLRPQSTRLQRNGGI